MREGSSGSFNPQTHSAPNSTNNATKEEAVEVSPARRDESGPASSRQRGKRLLKYRPTRPGRV